MNKKKSLSAQAINTLSFAIILASNIGAGLLVFFNSSLWWLSITISVIVSSLAFFIFHKLVVRPLKYSRKKENLNDKLIDLTARFNSGGSTELQALTFDVNRIVGRLHHTIYDIINVQHLSQELAESLIRDTGSTIEYISRSRKKLNQVEKNELELESELGDAEARLESIKEKLHLINSQIEVQDASLAQSSSAVEEMVASIQSISSTMQNQKDLNGEVGQLATASNSALEQFTTTMLGIQNYVSHVQQSINEIQDISEQSALLAMNASIEAAHAGEHGKGFSVVALEMRKLSERTKQNAQTVVGNLSQIAKNISDVSSSLNNTKESFSKLFFVLDTYRQNVENITSNLLEMNTGTNEILTSLASLQAISGEVFSANDTINSEVNPFSDLMLKIKSASSSNQKMIKETSVEFEGIAGNSENLKNLGTNNFFVLEALKEELTKIKITDYSKLKANDNQPLIIWDPVKKHITKRPDDPSKFKATESEHWWDEEFAGWNIEKHPHPISRADGAEGKKIAYSFASRVSGSSYVSALYRGAEKIASQNKIELTPYYADFDQKKQLEQVEQAIKDKVDLVIIQAIDPEKTHDIVVRLYNAGIPVINSLQTVAHKTFPYILNFTGPDDWGQTRLLARKFADGLGKKGNYCILQHVPGSSTELGRTHGVITELINYAPDMVFLEKAYPDFQTEKAYKLTIDWIHKFGSSLNGLFLGDDNDLALGVKQAILETGRNDIVICSAGNSKVGMDLVREGIMHAITYQSAEGAGALPIASAIDYFNGAYLPPVTYLGKKLITKENVDGFYPPQF